MNRNEEKEFYNKIGKTIGWDFSNLKCKMIDNSEFKYFDEIKKISKGKILLDIGTGGGEKILDNVKDARLIVGTDFSKEMINKAKKLADKRENAKFFELDSNNIQFPNGFFDIICARHTPFNAMEVHRTLEKGGILFSEQIDEDDCIELKNIFRKRTRIWKKRKKYRV